MYKKIIVWIMLCFLTIINISKADIQNVYFKFCEDKDKEIWFSNSKTLNIDAKAWGDICIYFYTSSPTPVKVQYGFSPWTVSAGVAVCDSDMWPNNSFSRFFVGSGERSFLIDSSSPQMIKEKIVIPPGMKGMQYGCFAYNLFTPEKQGSWSMFDIVVRKAAPLNMFIGGDTEIKNNLLLLDSPWSIYTTNKQVKIESDAAGKVSLSFQIKNSGDVEQNIVISGSMFNIFWFEKNFTTEVTSVRPWETKDIKAYIWIIPFYKSFFTVEFNLQNTPVFSFDASSLDASLKKTWNISWTATIYIFSWISLVIILLLVYIILRKLIFRKKKETPQIVYVQGPVPPTPTVTQ